MLEKWLVRMAGHHHAHSLRMQVSINAGSVVINGEVQGNVHAKNSIELHQPARVHGNLESPQLSIDKGVIFEGTSKMEALELGTGKPQAVLVSSPRPV